MKSSVLKEFSLMVLAMLLSTAALSSCGSIWEYPDDCDPNLTKNETINLSIRMISNNIRASRADNSGHYEIESNWPAFEDLIKTNDIALYLFWQSGDLLLEITDFTNPNNSKTTITGSNGQYIVTVAIPKKTIEEQSAENLELTAVVMANLKGYSGNNVYADLPTTSYQVFSEQIKDISFSFLDSENQPAFLPKEGEEITRGIPMYGCMDFSLSKTALENSQDEERIWVEDPIYLLRSVAKIEVIDAITAKDESGYPCISSVEIQSRSVEAYVVPDDSYNNGYQIHTIRSIIAEQTTTLPTVNLPSIPTTWLGYIPEQENTNSGRPVVNITIKFDDSGSETSQTVYSIPLTGYNNTPFTDFGTSILRNHIYRLSVEVAPDLILEACVKPYTIVELDPIFGLERPNKEEEEENNEDPAS